MLVRSCGGDGQVITEDGLVYGQVFAPGDLGSGIVTKPVHAEAPGQVFTPSDLGFGVVPKTVHDEGTGQIFAPGNFTGG